MTVGYLAGHVAGLLALLFAAVLEHEALPRRKEAIAAEAAECAAEWARALVGASSVRVRLLVWVVQGAQPSD